MYGKTILPGGLCVLTAAMPHTRSVTISIYVRTGSRYERREEAGLCHFVEHLCFKGSRKRPTARAISEAIDGIGGILNGGTDRELTVFYAKVAQPHFLLALDVLADMLRQPILDPQEMERERQVILEELAAVADSPAQQAELLIDSLLWPDHPLGWDVAGTEESLKAITRDRIAAFQQQQYTPNNMVVSVAGNIQHEAVVEAVGHYLGDWPTGTPLSWHPALDGDNQRRLGLRYKATEQAHLCLAARGLSMHDPDRYALALLSIILGEGMSSRLVLELREKRGLAYDVYSYVSHFLDTGAFTIYAGVAPAKAVEATDIVLQELAILDEAKEEELVKAKELAKGRLLLRLEDTRSVSAWMGGQEVLLGRVLTPEQVVANLDAVALSDARRLARDLLHPRRLYLAVVGPFRSQKRFARLLG